MATTHARSPARSHTHRHTHTHTHRHTHRHNGKENCPAMQGFYLGVLPSGWMGDFLKESRMNFYVCSHDSPDPANLLLKFLSLSLSLSLSSLFPFHSLSNFFPCVLSSLFPEPLQPLFPPFTIISFTFSPTFILVELDSFVCQRHHFCFGEETVEVMD